VEYREIMIGAGHSSNQTMIDMIICGILKESVFHCDMSGERDGAFGDSPPFEEISSCCVGIDFFVKMATQLKIVPGLLLGGGTSRWRS
jgi:hypothetical protein